LSRKGASTLLKEPLLGQDERFAINRESGVPLYLQVEERLAARIAESGTPNTLIPTEDELGVLFGVSRITVRRAVEALVSKGLLGRSRGVGTRILRTQMVEDLGRLRSYTEEVRGEGYEVVTKVLSARIVVPPKEVQLALRLKRGESALRIHRVRGTDAVFPVAVMESFFPERLGVTEDEDFTRSTYELIIRKLQVPMLWARQRISAANATPEQAKLLKLNRKQAVLVFVRTTFTLGDDPIEFVKGVFNPRYYSFSISMQR
jgi:GntR family transcriptional regulator